VDLVATGLLLRPSRQFLGEAAVVRHGPLPVGQPFLAHECRHALLRGGDVDVSSPEQFLQRQSFCRRLGMERKVAELHCDVVLVCKSFNTDRTEIAPRSDVIRIDFQDGLRFGGHGVVCCTEGLDRVTTPSS